MMTPTIEGYEVSTAGDRRFSALCARLDDGRTIEMHYQCDVKGYDPGGVQWRKGKGKSPRRPIAYPQLFDEYVSLWRQWADRNPELIAELHGLASRHGGILSDTFARGAINQATALAQILNERYPSDFVFQGSTQKRRRTNT